MFKTRKKCGTDFQAKNNWSLFCSDGCRALGAKERHREGQKRYRKKHREKVRQYRTAYHLEKTYGLAFGVFEQLLKDQNNSCAICQIRFNAEYLKERRDSNVDHHHRTGQVRGLICWRCNQVIGLLNDSTDLLGRLEKYLKGELDETKCLYTTNAGKRQRKSP